MVILKVLDKDENLIKSKILKKEDLYNRRGKLKSILDICLDNDIDFFYGCMGGSCGACKCRIKNGSEALDKEGIRKQVYKDMNEDEILTCISTIDEKKLNENKEIILKKIF